MVFEIPILSRKGNIIELNPGNLFYLRPQACDIHSEVFH